MTLSYKYNLADVERSWDYLLKSQAGFYIAFACSFLLLIFIVVGGLMMRIEMNRQQSERRAMKENVAKEPPSNDKI